MAQKRVSIRLGGKPRELVYGFKSLSVIDKMLRKQGLPPLIAQIQENGNRALLSTELICTLIAAGMDYHTPTTPEVVENMIDDGAEGDDALGDILAVVSPAVFEQVALLAPRKSPDEVVAEKKAKKK